MSELSPHESFRVLHAAVSVTPSLGVIRQMEIEASAAKQLKLPWDVCIFSGRPTQSEIVRTVGSGKRSPIAYLQLRYAFYRWLNQQKNHYQAILLRYSVHDAMQAMALHKSPNIWTVHHTLEDAELRGVPGFKGRLLTQLESHLAKKTLKRAHGIVSVTNEIAEEQQRRASIGHSLLYPNGVMYDSAPAEDYRGGGLELLFVAGGLPVWHGIDLLVKEIQSSSYDTRLHLVGPFDAQMLKIRPDDARFVFHGVLPSNAIRDVAARCDLAISCLALERKGMFEACPLKVREYLMLGLPVYGGYMDKSFPSDFPYYRKGPPELCEMIRFNKSLAKPTRQLVAQSSRPWIEKTVLLRRLYDQLQACHSP